MHKCAVDTIRCFDCRAVICRECMSVTNDSLRCKACDEKITKVINKELAPPSPLPMGVATVFYSFVIVKFMMVLSIYLPGLLQMALVAALLGVGMSFLVLKNIPSPAPRSSWGVAVGSIIVGTIICDIFDWFTMSKPGQPALPTVDQAILVGIIILTVTVRMRQSNL